MKKYIQLYRLYLSWFILGNAAGLWLLFETPSLNAVLTIKLFFYPVIYFLNLPYMKKYFCYFENMGHSARYIFTAVSVSDYLAFSILALLIKFIQHA